MFISEIENALPSKLSPTTIQGRPSNDETPPTQYVARKGSQRVERMLPIKNITSWIGTQKEQAKVRASARVEK